MWFRTLFNSLKSRPVGAGVRPAHNRLNSRLRVEALEDRVVPALHTWTGGGADDLWSNPANWDGGVPMSNEPDDISVVFTGGTSSVMDIAGLELDSISLFTENNTITLNTPLGALGELDIQSSGEIHTITGAQLNARFGLHVGGLDTFSTLIVESPISGTSGLEMRGSGTLTLRGTQSYSGTTRVLAGILEVSAGSSLLNSPVLLEGSNSFGTVFAGTLTGGGTVGTISGNGTPGSGRIAPGGGVSTQTLTAGNTFLSGVTYQPVIAGPNSDRLHVLGVVDLTGSALGVQPVRTPTAAAYTLIDNEGTDPITGTFTGLPEGAALFLAGRAYTISYVGGTGNDVVLTRAGEPTTPPAAPSGPPSAPRSQPAFSGAQVVGNILVLSGAGVPNGVQFVPVPLGSAALFTDLTGDGAGDVVLLSPTLTLVLDGRTGRFMALGADDNGDGTRDLWIFDLDGTITRIDGRTGLVLVF